VQTKNRRPGRHDDRGERATYYVYVPTIFKEIRRLSGKSTKRRLTETEHAHLHTYLLTNCEDVIHYERYISYLSYFKLSYFKLSYFKLIISFLYNVYMAELRLTYRHATEEELQQLRHNGFAGWLLNYVSVNMWN